MGFLGLAVAAFTTQTTEFEGTADLHLSFEDAFHKPVQISLTDPSDQPLKAEPNGEVVLHPKFETRETNIFDKFLGGPRPRTAVIAFYEAGHRHHEMTFTYDRHDHVWNCEMSFPDPTISKVDVEKSTLVFRGLDVNRRRYESSIFAKALIGPPIISND